MSADADVSEEAPKKRSKLPLLLGFVLAIVGGGGGFMATQMGLIGGVPKAEVPVEESYDAALTPELAFVAIDPLVVSLPATNGRDHLRFSAQLEVAPTYAAEVEAIKPRIVDVLNGYIRAVEITELEDPAAMMRLRAQMLRRVQVVAGEGRVKDLLIMEFVLS